MKTTIADKWFGLCVKESVGWRCEKCGKQYPQLWRGLHCSHFFGRGNYAVRFCPQNAFAHCHGCHHHLGSNPFIFDEWVLDRLGKEMYEILVEKSRDLSRGKEARRSVPEIAKHYQSEYERMLKLRSQGETRRLEFTEW